MIQRRNFAIIFILALTLFLFSSIIAFGVDNQVIAKNIEFVNADLRDVFRSLAEAGQFNVILEPAVRGEVTLSLKYGVTIKDAVSVIAKTYGYNCRWLADSPTVVIGNSNFIKENFERRSSKVFQLKYADPAAVAKSLEVVIPKNRIKADPKSNQITVMASDVEVANIAEIISGMDREMPLINIETKLEEVTDQFWKEIGVDNTFSPPHMGIYLLTEQQLKSIEGNSKINLLAKPNLIGLDNHEAKIFIGDKVPLITEKNKQGDINYKVEYVDAGTSLAITSHINADNKLTILVKAAVSTIANKSKPGANWVPWLVTRDFESTIRLEAGQAFLLSGLLQRNEYNMMKDSPYKFPVLSDLFLKENPAVFGSRSEVVILLKPKLMEKVDSDLKTGAQSTEPVQEMPSDQNPAPVTDQNSTPSVENGQIAQSAELLVKQPIDEEKPEVKITGSQAMTGESGHQTNDSATAKVNSKYTEISYKVKKGDSLAGIVKKFGSDLQLVVEKNKLGKTGSIKSNNILIIPVPEDRIYSLKPKETLWRIAKRYGTTLAVLKDLNGIIDETKVKADQQIVLPVPASKIINPQF